MAVHHKPLGKTEKNRLEDIPFDELIRLQKQMILIRRFEEATIKGYQQRKVAGFLHTYIGQEAIGCGVLAHSHPDDSVVTTYRCHGLGLILGMDVNACMAELWGRVTGCVRGKGGSMHYFSKEFNFLGGHGIVGGQFPIGIGAAFEMKYNKKEAAPGKTNVSFTFFGDGATPQGTFHESLNLASLWNLPTIFICEDNQYAMGTNKERILSNVNVAEMGKAYNVEGFTLNGMSLADTYFGFQEIIEKVRTTSRPVLVHVMGYRFRGHSVSDAALYRSKDEEDEWKAQDPIVEVNEWLMSAKGWTEEQVQAMDDEAKAVVRKAVEFADLSPEPPMEELHTHTCSQDIGLVNYGHH